MKGADRIGKRGLRNGASGVHQIDRRAREHRTGLIVHDIVDGTPVAGACPMPTSMTANTSASGDISL